MTTRCDTQRADSHFSIPAHNRPSRNGLDVNTFGAGSSSLPASDYSSRLTPTGLIHLDKYRPSLVWVVPPLRRVPLAVIERASHPLVPPPAEGQLVDAAVRVQRERFTPDGDSCK